MVEDLLESVLKLEKLEKLEKLWRRMYGDELLGKNMLLGFWNLFTTTSGKAVKRRNRARSVHTSQQTRVNASMAPGIEASSEINLSKLDDL